MNIFQKGLLIRIVSVAIALCLVLGTFATILPVTARADTTPMYPLNQPFSLAQNATYTITSDDADPLFHKLETKLYPGPRRESSLTAPHGPVFCVRQDERSP